MVSRGDGNTEYKLKVRPNLVHQTASWRGKLNFGAVRKAVETGRLESGGQ